MQRPAQRTRRQLAIGRGRIRQSAPGLYLDGGVKHRVNLSDAVQMSGHQLARGDAAPADQAGLLTGGEGQEVGCGRKFRGQVLFSPITLVTRMREKDDRRSSAALYSYFFATSNCTGRATEFTSGS
jgi:hypothetical protein